MNGGDAQAALIIAAQDTSDAAFNSANANLRGLESSVRSMSSQLNAGFSRLRAAAGLLGVSLSGRMFASWISHSLETTRAVGEQRESVELARQSFSEFRQASDDLAESIGVALTPAVGLLGAAMHELRRAMAPTESEKLENQIRAIQDEINRLAGGVQAFEQGKWWTRIFPEGFEGNREQIEKLRGELNKLYDEQDRRRNDPDLQEIDLQGIGRMRMPEDKIGLMLSRQREKEIEEARKHELEMVAAVNAERERFAQLEIDQAAELADAVAKERDRVALEEDEQAERRREMLAQQVEDVRLNLMTEVEFEAETYARRQEMLDAALQDQLISKQRHSQLSTELEQQTSQRIAQIRQQEAQREKQLQLMRLGGVANLVAGIAAITSVGAEDSKKKFETHKKIATAAAIVDTYAAVAYALRNPPGPPFSIPQAIAAGLFGFAQVKAIQSTSWSGGGAGGFGAAGGGEVPTASTIDQRTAGLLSGEGSGGRGAPMINITITGIVGRVDGETAREIGRAVKEQIDDYDFEIMSRGSAQVMTIRGEGVQDEGP